MDTSDRGLDAGQADCHFYFRLEEDIFGTEKKDGAVVMKYVWTPPTQFHPFSRWQKLL